MEAEELSVEDLGTDNGVSILKAWIQERYQEIEVSKIAETLTQFFRKLRRQQNQTVREFNSAFDRAYARLLEIDCKLPEGLGVLECPQSLEHRGAFSAGLG